MQIAQVSTMPLAARRTSSGAPVNFQVRVGNRMAGDVKLKSIQVQSVTENDAYILRPTTRPFDVVIPPSEFREVELWAPSEMQGGGSIGGNNGPATLRLTLSFQAETGNFTEVVIRQVDVRSTAGVD